MKEVNLEEHDDTPIEDVRYLIQELAALCGVPVGELCKPIFHIKGEVISIELDGPEARAECKFFVKNLPNNTVNIQKEVHKESDNEK